MRAKIQKQWTSLRCGFPRLCGTGRAFEWLRCGTQRKDGKMIVQPSWKRRYALDGLSRGYRRESRRRDRHGHGPEREQ